MEGWTRNGEMPGRRIHSFVFLLFFFLNEFLISFIHLGFGNVLIYSVDKERNLSEEVVDKRGRLIAWSNRSAETCLYIVTGFSFLFSFFFFHFIVTRKITRSINEIKLNSNETCIYIYILILIDRRIENIPINLNVK